MQLIINNSTNPAFNLALEEYALMEMKRDVTMLWRNEASVIIGCNQNAIEEIDQDFVRQNSIPVVRRLSGGGAVFHDLGNINFTVICELEDDAFGNYRKFAEPVCEFLRDLGVDAAFSGRNDLVIDGAKFSGNAQTSNAGRIMHHGTILFDADIARLARALKPGPAKIESKGVKSVHSRVTNVSEHLQEPLSVEQFFGQLADFFRKRTDGQYLPTASDIEAVQQLAAEKYDNWAWNFGHSPTYSHRRSGCFPFGTVDVRLQVENGFIKDAHIFGDFFGILEVKELESRLIGAQHNAESIGKALEGLTLSDYIRGATKEQFLELV
ncbi:MAG: lipoate--protein ligase [Clostridiales bacterium]|nr:lipoate--protein ligase [Clostridiales bacterium]